MVDSFKYLGLALDNNPSFEQHTKYIKKRTHQRLSAIRKLKGLYVALHLLLLLYQSIVQPIMLYCSTCFVNMLSVTNWVKLTCITNTVAKTIDLPTPNLSELDCKAFTCIATTIAQDIKHPLNCQFTGLPSGCRYNVPEVQKGSLRQKPGTHSQSSPKQGDSQRELRVLFSCCFACRCVVLCIFLTVSVV